MNLAIDIGNTSIKKHFLKNSMALLVRLNIPKKN